MPRKWCWDASAVLDLCPQSSYHSDFEDGDDFTCVGITRCGSPCRRLRGKQYRHKAADLLLSLGRVDPRSEEAADLLLDIACEMLCYQHDDQAEHMQCDWINVLDDLNTEACQLRSETKLRPTKMHSRAPAYSLPKGALWDPFLTVKLKPDGPSQCIGYAPSMGRKCHNPVAYKNFASGMAALEALGQLPPDSSKVKRQLPIIAKQLLCVRNHQAQHVEIVEKWGRLITAVSWDVPVRVQNTESPLEAKREKPKYAQVRVTEYTDATPRRRAPITTETTPISNSALPRTPIPVKPTSFSGLLTPPPSQEQVPEKLKEESSRALNGTNDYPTPPSSLPKVKLPTSKSSKPPTSSFTFSLPTPPPTDPKIVEPKMLEEPISSSHHDTSSSSDIERATRNSRKPPTGDFTFSLPTPPPSDPKPLVSKALEEKGSFSRPIPPSPTTPSPISATTSASPTVPALAPTSKIEEEQVPKEPTPSTSDFTFRSAPLPPPKSLEPLNTPMMEPSSLTPASPLETTTPTICDADPFTTHSNALTAQEHLTASCSSAPSPALVGSDVKKEEEDGPLETPYTPTRPPLRKHSPVTTQSHVKPTQLEAQLASGNEEVHGHATVFPTSSYTRPVSIRQRATAEAERSLQPPTKPPAIHIAVARKPLPLQKASNLPESIVSEPCSPPEATAASQIRAPVAHSEGVEDRRQGIRARARRRGWRWLRSLPCISSADGETKGGGDNQARQ